MIEVKEFYDLLVSHEIDYFTGVPDSQLKEFCFYINQNAASQNHIIAANEGNAVALAAGYHLATRKTGLVYMQNSGLGNAVNPITSLITPEVYGIPVIFLIGWRGQPGIKDEPQHAKQGSITLELLDLLGIPYALIGKHTGLEEIKDKLEGSFKELLMGGKSAAFVVEKDAFCSSSVNTSDNCYDLSREDAIQTILDVSRKDSVIVSTTGKASREVFEYRELSEMGHERDFLTVGSMGHASSIALSIAEHCSKPTICIDGDGAMLMHLGAAALIGNRKPASFTHILINNGVHESVGGMPTISYDMDWSKVADGMGYKKVFSVKTKEELSAAIKEAQDDEKLSFIEVYTNSASRSDLTRPTVKPKENKEHMMKFLREGN